MQTKNIFYHAYHCGTKRNIAMITQITRRNIFSVPRWTVIKLEEVLLGKLAVMGQIPPRACFWILTCLQQDVSVSRQAGPFLFGWWAGRAVCVQFPSGSRRRTDSWRLRFFYRSDSSVFASYKLVFTVCSPNRYRDRWRTKIIGRINPCFNIR
jgi:hypothetical protein